MGSTLIDPADPTYPPALMTLATPPALYLRGVLPAAPGITVVGTRAPSAAAVAFTRALVSELGRSGFAIWSGGALGIDAAAHEAALSIGARTVVVAGGGLDRPYPKEHCALFDRVLAGGGALLARVADDAPPTPPGFLRRNELLAALTVATVVIEAGLKSGARNTAAVARRLGRLLCVVPHAPWDARGMGCALELARGARAIACARDVLIALRATGALSAGGPRRGPASAKHPERARAEDLDGLGLDERELAVVKALGVVPTHIDEVCEQTAITPRAVAATLLTLTLRAVVVEGPAGFFRRARRP